MDEYEFIEKIKQIEETFRIEVRMAQDKMLKERDGAIKQLIKENEATERQIEEYEAEKERKKSEARA